MNVNTPASSFARATRRGFIAALAATCLSPWASAQAQASYPDRPVRIVVGFAAGTGPDIVARLLAQALSEGWNNLGVIVDNKAGAGGLIAASETARAEPDGYTLMLGATGPLSIAPSTYRKLAYDPQKDFVPVSQVVSTDFALLINPQKVPVRNLKDYVAWAKQQKGLFLATFGAGTLGHFGAYMFADAVGIKPEPVHYKNTSDAMIGLFNGDVQGVFSSVSLAAPQVKAGKLLALGTTDATRSAALPDVPTIKEQGFPNLEFTAWFGIVAPAGTPPAIISKLNADIVRAVQSSDTKKRLEEAGFRVTGTSADAFAKIIEADTTTWGKAVAATGFKAD